MPGLDIAEQQAWQNFLDCALRLYAALIRVSYRCWMCGRWTFSLPSR
ncbi:hypothetical protein JMUB5695_00235 [Mycobacterium heckeshornense]|nr:hypothetical protein JMUB5695_00235 [Mycobacterium heckeshornense]